MYAAGAHKELRIGNKHRLHDQNHPGGEGCSPLMIGKNSVKNANTQPRAHDQVEMARGYKS